MLTNNKHLRGFIIQATDGEIGSVDELYFDDRLWAVRYLTVETGGWLDGRKVLISPPSIVRVDSEAERIHVSMTRKQVEKSPDIHTHRPVSRQHEEEYFRYYGYPYYWDGPYLWGSAYLPTEMVIPASLAPDAAAGDGVKASEDSHLRGTEAVTGYHIEATTGEIGHVDCFIVDDAAWAIRYLEVATKNWWPGKKVLLSPGWVERVSWEESKVFVAISREAIQSCPEYNNAIPITRDYEHLLFLHYGLAPYWIESDKRASALA
jgi:hypothetical protein